MVTVVDAFPFFNEFGILEARLLELNPVVDVFLLVEANVTHSGNPKPLFFTDAVLEKDPRFVPFLHKVVVVQANLGATTERKPESVEGGGGEKVQMEMMAREERQRNFIAVGLRALADGTARPAAALVAGQYGSSSLPRLGPEDLVLVSDTDEVLRQSTVQGLRQCWSAPARGKDAAGAHSLFGLLPVRLLLDWYLYTLEWRSPQYWGLRGAEGAYAAAAKAFLLPEGVVEVNSFALAGAVARAKGLLSRGVSPAVPSTDDAGGAHYFGTASQWRRAMRSIEARSLLTAAPPGLPTLQNHGERLPFQQTSLQKPALSADCAAAEGLGAFSVLVGAGWHFSSFGGAKQVEKKLGAYIGAATFAGEKSSKVYQDRQRLERLVRHGVGYFDLGSLQELTELPGGSTKAGARETYITALGCTAVSNHPLGTVEDAAKLARQASAELLGLHPTFFGGGRVDECVRGTSHTHRMLATDGAGGFVRTPAGDPLFEGTLPEAVFSARAAVGQSQAEGRLQDIFGTVAASLASSHGYNKSDRNSSLGEEEAARRELYLLNQDIRWAVAAAAESAHFVVDAIGARTRTAGDSDRSSSNRSRFSSGGSRLEFSVSVRKWPLLFNPLIKYQNPLL